jgi:Holliday junction resolvasome RuvABC endonuclease subunit
MTTTIHAPGLSIPDRETFRWIALDPGTDTLGVAVFEALLQGAPVMAEVVDAWTLEASRGVRLDPVYQQLEQTHSGRFARLSWLHDKLRLILDEYQPHDLCSESPFMMRSKGHAFAALVECMSMIKSVWYEYTDLQPLATVSPFEAKKAVGLVKMSSDKEAVAKCIRNRTMDERPDLAVEHRLLDALDEHATDAIAVGYAYYQTLKHEEYLG